MIFETGDETKGLFIIIEGVVNEEFNQEHNVYRSQGSILGVNSIIERHYTYDSKVSTDTYCSCVIVTIDQV